MFQNREASGNGDSAYFNKGVDARQLWVKLNDKGAFAVGFGDVPNAAGAEATAKLLEDAIQ